MTEDVAIGIGSEAIKTVILLAGPMLVAALAIGLVVSVLQAITQINESTLTFIPKMVAVVVVLMVMGPWMLEVLSEYTVQILESAGELGR